MSNYLNLKFNNDMNGFKKWALTFKHMMSADVRVTCYFNSGDYYLELNKVQIREFGNHPFLGKSLRKFNPEDNDFQTVHSAEEETKILTELFAEQISKFCTKHNVPCRW